MGYLPKHIKVRRHKWNMRIIAMAAISGAMFQEDGCWYVEGTVTTYRYGWTLIYADGQRSHLFTSKSSAAAHYLVWWFSKNNMWPKRRAA